MSDERDIQQVIAKYVRAVDRRDGVALAELFIPNGKVTIFYTNGGKEELIVELAGREVIGNAVSNLMKAHPARGWTPWQPTGPMRPVLPCSGSLAERSAISTAEPMRRLSSGSWSFKLEEVSLTGGEFSLNG